MSAEDEKDINKQRVYWQDKAHSQFMDILFASLEGDKEKHKRLMDDLGTSLTIIWRFDHRLSQFRGNGNKKRA